MMKMVDLETYRCVGIEVPTHVLNFQLQLVLGSSIGALDIVSITSPATALELQHTLKARCSRK